MKNFGLAIAFAIFICSFHTASASLIQAEGSLVSLYVDRGEHEKSEIRHYLRTKNHKAYRVKFKHEPKHPEKINRIKVQGDVQNNTIEVESYQEDNSDLNFSLAGGTVSEAKNNQRTLVVPIKNSTTNTGFLYSSSKLEDLYFSNSQTSLQTYFDEVSDSLISFTGGVGAEIDMAGIPADSFIDGVCVESENLFDGFAWLYAIDAIYKQHNLRNVDRLSVVVPNDSLCLGQGILGLGTLGKEEFEDNQGNRFAFSFNFVRSYREPVGNDNTFVSVAAHEMGHNLGLKHDNGNGCGQDLITAECESIEYGGAYSIMGYAGNLAHVNAIHQEDLGWFDNSELVKVSGTAVDQTITIAPIASDSNLPKAIKIARGDGSFYMVEYPKAVNIASQKAFNNVNTYDGFLVYLNDDSFQSDSILFRSDFLKNTSAVSFSDHSTFNTSFVDDTNDIQIIPINLANDTATLRVVIGSSNVTTNNNDPEPEPNTNEEEPDVIANVSYPGKTTTTALEPVLEFNKKTKLRLILDLSSALNLSSGDKLRVLIGNSLVRPHIKQKIKAKLYDPNKLTKFPLKFDAEQDLADDFSSFLNSDSYYELPLTLRISKQSGENLVVSFTVLVKSST